MEEDTRTDNSKKYKNLKTKSAETKEKNTNTALDGLKKSVFKQTYDNPVQKEGDAEDKENESDVVAKLDSLQIRKETEDNSGAIKAEEDESAPKLPQEIEEGNIEYKVQLQSSCFIC
jgi:hypothetical protein